MAIVESYKVAVILRKYAWKLEVTITCSVQHTHKSNSVHSSHTLVFFLMLLLQISKQCKDMRKRKTYTLMVFVLTVKETELARDLSVRNLNIEKQIHVGM